jgi:hypothetical protein
MTSITVVTLTVAIRSLGLLNCPNLHLTHTEPLVGYACPCHHSLVGSKYPYQENIRKRSSRASSPSLQGENRLPKPFYQ